MGMHTVCMWYVQHKNKNNCTNTSAIVSLCSETVVWYHSIHTLHVHESTRAQSQRKLHTEWVHTITHGTDTHSASICGVCADVHVYVF